MNFGTLKIIFKKVTRTLFKGVSGNGSKNRPTFRKPKSDMLLIFITLEQGQTSQKWTPFWELFEDQFCTKYEKNWEMEDTQK